MAACSREYETLCVVEQWTQTHSFIQKGKEMSQYFDNVISSKVKGRYVYDGEQGSEICGIRFSCEILEIS